MKFIRLFIIPLSFIYTSAFAFEPSNSEGMEAHIYLESNQAGSVSKVWGRPCKTCKGEPFSVLKNTEFTILKKTITQQDAFLKNGNDGVIIYNTDTREATQVIFFQ